MTLPETVVTTCAVCGKRTESPVIVERYITDELPGALLPSFVQHEHRSVRLSPGAVCVHDVGPEEKP